MDHALLTRGYNQVYIEVFPTVRFCCLPESYCVWPAVVRVRLEARTDLLAQAIQKVTSGV